ncbi:MAG: MCE family protein [Elusimicrobia bacterium]|nr:MCE family protein [Elusimicrobiota bacterium]
MGLSQETKVGLLVLISLIILGAAIFLVGDFRLERGYTLKILFNDVSGLQVRAPVKTAGVQIGAITKVDLSGGKAQVTVWIKGKLSVFSDARATIASTGLIGTKYLELYLGTKTAQPLKEGNLLIGIDPVSFDKIVNEGLKGFTDLAEAVKSFTGDKDMKESLQKIFTNFSSVLERVNTLLSAKNKNINNIVDNFEQFSGRINQVAIKLDDLTGSISKEDLKTALDNFKSISAKLDTALTSLNNIAAKIEGGQGTLGKLVNDEQMADEVKGTVASLRGASDDAKKLLARIGGFKTYWDYNLNRNSVDTLTRSDFGIRIRPKPDKFYYFAVNNLKSDRPADLVTGATLKYDQGNQKYNSFTAELGKDFGPFTLYGGLIKSTGGFGAGWRLFPANPRLELYSEAFRFDRKVNNQNKAWINAGASYKLTKWLNVKVNYEDALEQKAVNATMNLYIEDDDIAYFLGLSGLSSLVK